MIGFLNLIPVFSFIGIVFFLSLLCFTLRDGSLKQLERACRAHQRQSRLGRILQDRQPALLACEIALMVVLSAGAWFAARNSTLQLLVPPETPGWMEALTHSSRAVGAVLLIALFWVAIPRSIARARGGVILYQCRGMLRLIARVTLPMWSIVERLDRLIHRTTGVEEPDIRPAQRLSDEIMTLVDEGQQHGVIWPGGSRMIHGLLDLHDTEVSSIMTPRINLVAIPSGTNLYDANALIMSTGYSRLPVIRDSIDDITGILYARDLLRSMADGADLREEAVDDLTRPVVYVPESQRIDSLIDEMQQKKIQLAVVVDEYSGVAGLVTMEDIMEEIIGDISDEFDPESPKLMHQQDGVIEADARAHIDDLNEEFHLELPEEADYDTLNGFLLTRFGRIPKVGEAHQWRNIRLTVLDADERQLKRVRVERLEASVQLAELD